MSTVVFYKLDKDYLKKLQTLDSRVSLKNNRAFVGVLITISQKDYCIPLTSTIIPESGKKRNSLVTVNVKDRNEEIISCLLINNMIPIKKEACTRIDFELLEENNKRYHIEEFIFITKHYEAIEKKANSIYRMRIEGKNPLLNAICCDFELLEANIK